MVVQMSLGADHCGRLHLPLTTIVTAFAGGRRLASGVSDR